MWLLLLSPLYTFPTKSLWGLCAPVVSKCSWSMASVAHTWMWEKPRETKTKDLISGAVYECLEFLTQRGRNHTTVTPFPGSGARQTHSID